jgi:molybdopterin/thiamine biosynthesis adenylyltransferase
MRGVGAEVVKNLVIMGVGSVTVCDSTLTTLEDLGANYFLTEEDVGVCTRAYAIAQRLSQLRPDAQVSVSTDPLTPDLLKQFSAVVMTTSTQEQMTQVNEI